MRKLLTTKSSSNEVPMSVQCNIIGLIGNTQDIITFVFIRCSQMAILKNCSIWSLQLTKYRKDHSDVFYRNGCLTKNP